MLTPLEEEECHPQQLHRQQVADQELPGVVQELNNGNSKTLINHHQRLQLLANMANLNLELEFLQILEDPPISLELLHQIQEVAF